MYRVLILFVSVSGLFACSSNDSRYRDTQMLERPPTLPITKRDEALECCIDDAILPQKSNEPGLGDKVSLIPSKPMTIKIKQPFETAWNNVGLALAQSDIKITDQERKQGIYYVAYKPKTLFGDWLSGSKKDVIYQLNVTAEGNETKVSCALGNTAEQTGTEFQFESDLEEAQADAEDLLYRLYETLRDDLVNH